MMTLPTFIAFTGVDDAVSAVDLQALSARYPIEWGMLLDAAQESDPLFPVAEARGQLIAAPGLRWAAHVCGAQARLIADAPGEAAIDLSGFQRVQVNHGFSGSSAAQIVNVIRFGRALGVRSLLQTLRDFPDEPRLDWLFDVSFGTGAKPATWPPLPESGAFCGYSGGINPGNATAVVAAIAAPPGAQYWIDMESGVRTAGRFDLDKCEAVCRAVYG